MRITIDDDSAQYIKLIKTHCKLCPVFNKCKNPYRTTKDIIKSALMKFQSADDCGQESAED